LRGTNTDLDNIEGVLEAVLAKLEGATE